MSNQNKLQRENVTQKPIKTHFKKILLNITSLLTKVLLSLNEKISWKNTKYLFMINTFFVYSKKATTLSISFRE